MTVSKRVRSLRSAGSLAKRADGSSPKKAASVGWDTKIDPAPNSLLCRGTVRAPTRSQSIPITRNNVTLAPSGLIHLKDSVMTTP